DPWRRSWPEDGALATIGAIGMLLMFALVPVSTVIGDRLGYYLIPLQAMIFARIPWLPLGKGKTLHTVLPYVGLILIFTVWTLLSRHFQQCYLPYSSWIFGFPDGLPFQFK